VDVESPVLIAEVAGRLARSCGLGRVRRQTEKALRDAAAFAASSHMIVKDGDVLWSTNDKAPVIRDRSQCPGGLRLTESVPMVEIEWAVQRVVQLAGPIRRDDIARAASRLLGFHRTTDPFSARVEGAIERALECRAITLKDDLVRIRRTDSSEGPERDAPGSPGERCRPSPTPSPSQAPDSQSQGDESSVEEKQARILIRTLPDSADEPRRVLWRLRDSRRSRCPEERRTHQSSVSEPSAWSPRSVTQARSAA
jgi:hypothetical protein